MSESTKDISPALCRSAATWPDQEMVDLAYGASMLAAARAYGLVTGGPVVNQAFCDFILSEGRKLRIFPRRGAAERFALAAPLEETKS